MDTQQVRIQAGHHMLPCTAGHQGQNSGRSSDVLYCQDIKIIRSSDVVLYSWSESRQVTTFCPVLPGRQGQNLGRSPHVSLYCQGVKVRIQAGHHMLPCIARTSRPEFRQIIRLCFLFAVRIQASHHLLSGTAGVCQTTRGVVVRRSST